MILDSLGLHRLRTISSLKKYLVMEAKHKLNLDISEKKITGIHVKAPLQPNHCDCGVYVLHNIETFLKTPNKYLRYCLERQTCTLDWYSTDEIPKKRIMMKKLVQELSKVAEETGEQKNFVNLDDHSDCEIID